MRYVDEYRDRAKVEATLAELGRRVTKPWTIMEVCGGQTHSIMHFGLDQLLPEQIELVHGPGCPVCVTPLEMIDRGLAIAAKPEVIFCSFGDMLRVPGSEDDLFRIKARGGDVRIVYSPLDAVQIAFENPDREVVFFGVGFETTAPAHAMALKAAHARGLSNFSLLTALVRVPPAISAILGSPTNRVQAFLAAGHVCTVMGYWEYEPLAKDFEVPIVATGFEPLDLAQGILMTVEQLEAGRAEVANQYTRAVTREGNPAAQATINEVFAVCDRQWRGIGLIPDSGWRIRDEYRQLDAELRFDVAEITVRESEECIAGLVLRGEKKPSECPVFGTKCTPTHPLGAPMVSSEGACSAYFRYKGAPE